MVTEITVIVKDEERTLRQKFLQYEPFCFAHDDETLKAFVKQTLESLEGSTQDVEISIKASMVFS